MKTLIAVILLLILTGCSGDSVVCAETDSECASGNPDTATDAGNNGGDNDNNGDNGSAGENPANGSSNTLQVSGLAAFHRSGQTFLTWNEPDTNTQYHVYRSSQAITTNNLSSATRLTNRWGPLDADTSVHKYGNESAPGYFVIQDLGAPLSDSTGLFVHTTQNGQAGTAHYAVTTVKNGNENKTIATTITVNESVTTPRPVLTSSRNGGKGRVYTQYMDYVNWNPTFNGYAFNYSVALPFNYSSSRTYPLQVQLHAFGEAAKALDKTEFNWQVIQLFPVDPGVAENSVHTWWYGHAADHNYKTGTTPAMGKVENFTQQRIIRSINDVISNSDFSVNTNLVYAYGNSMGASGAVSLAMHYPSVFAGVYASQPMTNYATSPLFQRDFNQLWGTQSSNLPIVNRGPESSAIAKYSVGGSRSARVWDWMNHQQQLRNRRGDEFAFMMMDFGKADTVIDWQTQGRPMFQALTDGKAAFTATALEGVGHNWLAFNAVNNQQFGMGTTDELAPWRYPNSLSFVALQFATGSGSLQPNSNGNDEYNTTIEWSTPHNSFHQNIVDTANRYEISLRSTTANQTASVTPRNTQAFNPSSGRRCNWTATRNSDNTRLGSGNLTVDGNALATAAPVPINSGSGTRLVITCS